MKPLNKSKRTNLLKNNAAVLLLVGTILLAIFFRFYQLNSLPPGLNWLEAASGLAAQQVNNGHKLALFYSTIASSPQEALFILLQAAALSILGVSAFALRVIPAALGVLTVLITYLWAKNWFGRRIGLAAAFLLAINTWVVIISRTAMRVNLVPLLVALFAFLVGKTIQTKNNIYAVLSGIVLSIGLYAHLQLLGLWLAVAIGLIVALIFKRDFLVAYKNHIIIAAISSIVLLVPLVVSVVSRPSSSSFSGMTQKLVVLDQSKSLNQRVVKVVENKAKILLGLFSFGRGDQDATRNVPGEPLLNTFVALMWVLGLVITISKLKSLKYFFLLLLFASMTLPAVLYSGLAPNGLLLLGAAPIIMIMAGIGVDYMLARWYQTFPVNSIARTVGLSLVMVLFALSAYQSYKAYFVAYAGDVTTQNAFDENIYAIAAHAKANNIDGAVLLSGPEKTTITELLGSKGNKVVVLNQEQIISLPISVQKQIFYIPASSDGLTEKLELLKAKFPTGRLIPHYSSFDNRLLFYQFEVSK